MILSESTFRLLSVSMPSYGLDIGIMSWPDTVERYTAGIGVIRRSVVKFRLHNQQINMYETLQVALF